VNCDQVSNGSALAASLAEVALLWLCSLIYLIKESSGCFNVSAFITAIARPTHQLHWLCLCITRNTSVNT
jgi:hypothetical protein